MSLLDNTPTLQPPTYTPPTYTPQQATAQQATSTGYTPESFAVTPQQTIQGQLPGIIDTDSPLMRQAATRAKQEMNARGLLNSSMAIGAGHEAVIGAALPIAQNDAGVFERAGTNTVNAKNAALNFGANAQNQSSLANAQLGTNVNVSNAEAQNKASSEYLQAQQQGSLANLDSQTRIYATNLDAQTRMALGQLDATTKTNLATLDGQYRQLLQTNQGASQLMQQALTNIANISNNNTLSETAKKQAIQSQVNSLQNSLNTLSLTASTPPTELGGLNIGSLWTDYSVDDEGVVGQTPPPGTTSGTGGTGGTTTLPTGETATATPTPSTPFRAGSFDFNLAEYYPTIQYVESKGFVGANGQYFYDAFSAAQSLFTAQFGTAPWG
jgi:hypothetical protein